ncbi:hypothetical protein [Curtobacterium sp. NPDC089185]|uniref:hypothetical protein n=1 Tax=Curtobacterium sp. NPDC089185 TaxID=3154968 RepID=UPI0034498016
MDRVGVVDEAGRLRLLGSAVAGAAFGVVLAVLVASSWATTTTGLVVGVGVPAAVLGGAVGVWTQLRSWRAAGGYEHAVAVQRWVAEGRVPLGVPAEEWVPALQAQADREGAGWGKVVLCVLWTAMTLSMADQHGPVLTTLLAALWIGMGTWSVAWVIPRARAARALLQRAGAALPGPVEPGTVEPGSVDR